MLFGYTAKQLIRRITQEIGTPQTSFGKKIKLIFLKKYQTKVKKNLNLNLLYNLDYNSATFDFGYVLLMIDKYAKENNINFNVIIIKRKRKDIKDWYPLNLENINKRIENILVPLAKSFIKCEKIIIYEDLKEIKRHKKEVFFPYDLKKNIYFFNYNFFYRYLLKHDNYHGILPNDLFIKEINKIIYSKGFDNKKIITLTVRNYSFEEERNTNPCFWLKVLSHFEHKYFIIIIPDIENLNDRNYYDMFKKYFIFNDCAKSLYMKIALYNLAALNYFPHTGNSVLSQLNKNSCSLTILNTYENRKNLNKSYFNRIGQNVGENYKFLTKKHKICWNSKVSEIVNISNKLLH